MSDMKYVTYCGLYCKLCANIARIPQQARDLRETMQKDSWEFFGEHCMPGFNDFYEFLGKFTTLDETHPGCRGGCGNPECQIRICAKNKGVEVCSACEEYPCQTMQWLVDKYPNIVADGQRQQKVGMEQWIKEQEARRKAGFCYNQIRHP